MISDPREKLPELADLIYEVLNFNGGMNTRASQLSIGQQDKFSLLANQCIMLINFLRTSSGALETRPGYSPIFATPVSPPSGDAVIRSIFDLRPNSGSGFILINAGNTVYKWNGAGWTSLGTVATANRRMIWTQFNDDAIGVNGIDPPITTNGTTFGALGGSPSATSTAVYSHRNRVWMLDGRTLRYSALGAPADWSTPNNAGTLPIPTSRGSGGTALFGMWDRLIVWTAEQVFQVVGSGPSDFAMVPVNLQFGHEGSPDSVLPAGNDVFYLNRTGAHALSTALTQSVTGDVEYNYASGLIEPTWQAINKNNLTNIVAVNDSKRNLVWFFSSRTGTNNTEALVADYYHMFDEHVPTWTIASNMGFASAREVLSLNSEKDILLGGYDGKVYRLTGEKDDGKPINSQFQYVTDGGMASMTKLWRYMILFINAKKATLSGNITYDFGETIKSLKLSVDTPASGAIGVDFKIGSSPIGIPTYKQKRLGIAGHGRLATVNVSVVSDSKITIGGLLFFAGLRRIIHH